MYGLQAALHGGHGVAHQAERHVTIVTGRTTSSLCAGIAYKKLQDVFPCFKASRADEDNTWSWLIPPVQNRLLIRYMKYVVTYISKS